MHLASSRAGLPRSEEDEEEEEGVEDPSPSLPPLRGGALGAPPDGLSRLRAPRPPPLWRLEILK